MEVASYLLSAGDLSCPFFQEWSCGWSGGEKTPNAMRKQHGIYGSQWHNWNNYCFMVPEIKSCSAAQTMKRRRREAKCQPDYAYKKVINASYGYYLHICLALSPWSSRQQTAPPFWSSQPCEGSEAAPWLSGGFKPKSLLSCSPSYTVAVLNQNTWVTCKLAQNWSVICTFHCKYTKRTRGSFILREWSWKKRTGSYVWPLGRQAQGTGYFQSGTPVQY